MWMSSQYLDDQMSGYDFYGNTIINASTGVLLGGGTEIRLLLRRFSHEYLSEDRSFDKTSSGQTQEQTWENDKTGRRNRIHSNVFLDNNLDIAFDNRGMNWMVSFTSCNAATMKTKRALRSRFLYYEKQITCQDRLGTKIGSMLFNWRAMAVFSIGCARYCG